MASTFLTSVAVLCPVVTFVIGRWFDRIGPIEGNIERFLYSTWPMVGAGSVIGVIVMTRV
jgi:hypothetical protein